MVKNVSVGKADGENVVSLGTDAWNVADGFTKIKILRLLIELDLWETIAQFGRKDMEEEVALEDMSKRREEALHRMVFTLRQLIGNCKFTLERKDKDKEAIDILMRRLRNVEKVLDGVSYEVVDDVQKTKVLFINEKHFNVCFDILREIKDEVNIPINRAGLIFRQSEEIDLDKIMKDIVEGG